MSAPLLAPARRRGALDMGVDSTSDSGVGGHRSSAHCASGGGPLPGTSEIDALYSDVTLLHRGR